MPPIGGQDSDGVSNRCSALYTLCLFEAFPSRGNEKYGEEKQRVIYFMYHSAVSPFGGERSEPITGMLNMPYDTESQSRNADFISIARRAIHNPRPEGPSNLRTFRPIGPVNLKNPFSTTFFHNPFPQPFYTTRRRQAATTLGAQPRQPSHRRSVQRQSATL